MLDGFLFVGLAYVAVFVCAIGLFYRIIVNPFSQSAQTSQFLESRTLLWGVVPFHIGIITVVLGHLVAILMPGLWKAAVSHRVILLTIETVGLAASALCVFGLIVLFWRRVVTPRLQIVTTTMDLIVLALLLVQVISGIAIALGHQWGAAWAPHTLVPYVWSLATLQPDVAYVTNMAPAIQGHVVLAWILILLIPFSRLSHFFALPLAYAVRRPQKVVWASTRHEPAPDSEPIVQAEQRRLFLRGAGGTGIAVGLLTVGAADKAFQFFKGPEMTSDEEEEFLEKKVARLKMTLHQRELELERKNATHVFVAKYADLSDREGKYFIDFDMNPAIALLGSDGVPLVLSAKCTHLGCTVGNRVDDEGRVLCPCHISYFDVRTGEPNKGSPANTPLPRLGWVLKDPRDEIIASGSSSGTTEGVIDPGTFADCSLFIARPAAENA